jgi:hypothetical protein
VILVQKVLTNTSHVTFCIVMLKDGIRLRESGLRARRPVVGPILKQRHMTARLAWDRARRRWRLHTWQHILFSDESRISLRFNAERYRVHRRCGERFTDSVLSRYHAVPEVNKAYMSVLTL